MPELWPFWHGLPWLAILMIACAALSWLILPALASLGIRIYLGIKGGELAVQHRLYRNDQEFERVENAWTLGGILVIAVPFALAISIILITVLGANVSNAFASVNNGLTP